MRKIFSEKRAPIAQQSGELGKNNVYKSIGFDQAQPTMQVQITFDTDYVQYGAGC